MSHATEQGHVAGLLRDGHVHELEGAATLLDLLRADGLAAAAARTAGEGMPLGRVDLLPPVERPGKIICIGQNYRAHAEEQGSEPPATPTFFAKFANSLRPAGATVELPAFSERVDYEAEVAFVIGRPCKDVAVERAMDHVAGFMLFNDLSARDYQYKTPQWMPGKTFDGSAPCGPALVSTDEAGPHDAIEIELHLNGERMQQGSTADLVHSVPALVAYLSMLMTLEPGDLIATGTPAGVGNARDPKVWLRPGDEVVVSSPQLGVLETRLA